MSRQNLLLAVAVISSGPTESQHNCCYAEASDRAATSNDSSANKMKTRQKNLCANFEEVKQ